MPVRSGSTALSDNESAKAAHADPVGMWPGTIAIRRQDCWWPTQPAVSPALSPTATCPDHADSQWGSSLIIRGNLTEAWAATIALPK